MTSTAPAVIDQRPLAPLDLAATKASMTAYQEGLHSLLDETDWQRFGTGKDERAFVKRSGWRKIATWFSLNLETRSIDVQRDKHDNPVRASVIARATAPNGRYCEGEGAASVTERRFSKPEHDLPATAATRAINRAISNLVGLGAVSAEEVEPDPAAGQPYGPLATEEDEALTAQTIQKFFPNLDGFALVAYYDDQLGVARLPVAAARIVRAIDWALTKGRFTGQDREPENAPPADPAKSAYHIRSEDVYPPAPGTGNRYQGD
jgi:hypothetical protein